MDDNIKDIYKGQLCFFFNGIIILLKNSNEYNLYNIIHILNYSCLKIINLKGI